MKELGLVLASLLVCANAQIVFPDQLESLQNPYASDLPPRPFPTLPSGESYGFDDVPVRNVAAAPQYSTKTVALPISGASSASSSVPSFSTTGNAYDDEAQRWSNHVNDLIARGVTKFTLDMDRAIYRTQTARSPSERKNIVFSPLSVVGTLAMVLLGSSGTTFDEVARILGLETGVDISQHSEIVHQMFGLLLDSVLPKPNITGPRVTIASGIFVQNGYPIRPEFRAISQQAYKNEVINLDFVNHPNEARRTINDWVKARTNGKIGSIVTQPLDHDTKLILASALYFNGEWNRHFIPRATKRKPFMVTPTQSVTVDMMYGGGEYSFYEDKQLGVKIIALPYKGNYSSPRAETNVKYQASMYVLLPTSTNEEALSDLENRLTPEVIDYMISRMVERPCVLGIPRMTLSSNLNLNEALQSLGLNSLFDRSTSNLGLLTPGYDTTADRNPSISGRFGEPDEDKSSNGTATTDRTVDGSTKKNYFRYEDKKGGYRVQQWNSGVTIEKIRRTLRRKRTTGVTEARGRRSPGSPGSRGQAESYQSSGNSTDRVKVVAMGEDRYKFDGPAARTRRQSRPIDDSFVRFFRSRNVYPEFGLDELRNSRNIGNPGIFASDVLHKVEINVTETGTVGAAATSIILQRGGDIKRFVAERPFLFFIRHEPSRLMLFWGKVNRPTPSY